MVLAGAWYGSATFWTAFGAIAVVVMSAVATYFGYFMWRQGGPTRHLVCTMSAVPLSQEVANKKKGSLKTVWNDGPALEEPHILQVNLISRRRQYVGTDDSKSLEFKVNARIITIMRIDSSQNFGDVDFQDNTLKVGPAFIGPRQSVNITLLTDGPEPTLTPPPAQHLEVTVLPAEPMQQRSTFAARLATRSAVIAMAAVLVLAGFLIHQQPPGDSQQVGGHPGATVSPQTSGPIQAAITDLQSANSAVQLDGIDGLQGLMKTSPGDQFAAIQALAKYIVTQSPSGNNDQPVTANVQAALNVLRARNSADDDGAVLDLGNTNFTGAALNGIDLSGADLTSADFSSAQLNDANFQGANLSFAFFGGSTLTNASFNNANLNKASFYQTTMCNGSVPVHAHEGYNCSSS